MGDLLEKVREALAVADGDLCWTAHNHDDEMATLFLRPALTEVELAERVVAAALTLRDARNAPMPAIPSAEWHANFWDAVEAVVTAVVPFNRDG
jgi:hypothetical protein